jgi:hypothetical protein
MIEAATRAISKPITNSGCMDASHLIHETIPSVTPRTLQMKTARFCSKGNCVAAMHWGDFYLSSTGLKVARSEDRAMRTRMKQKTATKTKPKRNYVSCEKEAWYATAAARFSAAKPNLAKAASSH